MSNDLTGERPIPTPLEGESEKDFISRCMEAIGDEYPPDQALAICYKQWEDRGLVGEHMEEV